MGTYGGKVVVLTGASSGIGRAVALELAAQGARLALAARDRERLEAVAAECRGRGGEAEAVPTDVTDPGACRLLVERAAQRFGRIDALVNNAGVGMIARFEDVTDLSIFEQVVRVNYLGSVYPTWHALPHLRKTRGQIVAVASLTALTGVPTRTAYAASKHAMLGFFDSLRVELRGSGVDVTVVCPDFVVSEIHHRAFGPDGRPLGHSRMDESRVMTAEQCARETVRAMEKRKRLAVLSARGRLGRVVRLLAPGLIDAIAARAVERGR